MTHRPLVMLAHGTANPDGREVVYAVGRAVAQRLPDVVTTVGFVDVCEPSADQVLAAHPDAVVVPYLLTSGFHVRSDIPAAMARAGGGASATKALGVTPEVVDVLLDRLNEKLESGEGAQIGSGMLAAAGSSDARARQEVLCTAAVLAACWGKPVQAGFMTGTGPRAADVLSDLQASNEGEVAVLSYLLATGHFHTKAMALGADVVTEPLGVHDRLVDAVVQRYRSAASAPLAVGVLE